MAVSSSSVGRRRPLGVVIAMVIAMTLAVTMAASVTPRSMAEDFSSADASAIESATVELTATVKDGDRQETRTFTGDELRDVENVVPNTAMDFYLEVHLKDDAVNGNGVKKLDWQYDIPLPSSMVNGTFGETHTVMDGSRKVADITLVKVAGNPETCALQVQYDPDYAADKDHDFYFSYTVHTTYKTEVVEGAGNDGWEFPGTGLTVKVDHTPWKVDGSKNCSWNGRSETEMTCTVRLEADGDVDDFKFWDIAGNDLRIDGSTAQVKYLYNGDEDKGNAAAAQLQQSFNGDLPTSATPAGGMTLAKGTYEITYIAIINNDAQADANDGNKYQNAKNTANWSWKDGSGSADYVPAKRTWNINWVDKNGYVPGESQNTWWQEEPANPREIKWTLQLNNGSDRGNLAGRTVTDTIGDGHTLKQDSLQVRAWDENNQEIQGAPLDFAINTDGSGFSCTFPADVENYAKYEITYLTEPTSPTDESDGAVTKYHNKVVGCTPEYDCVARETQVDRPSKPTQPDTGNPDTPNPPTQNDKVDAKLITKSVGSASKIAGTNVYKVPWTLTYTPPAEGDVRELHLFEDWVNGISDGNTLHMWYSKDYLDLTVSVYNPPKEENGQLVRDSACREDNPACWVDVPADQLYISAADKRSNVAADSGYSQEYYDIREAYYDDSYHRPGRDLPGGTDYPEGYLHVDPTRNGTDTYNLHDGAPAFTFSYMTGQVKTADGRILFDKDKPFTSKMRITYNTVCDGTPDLYINYAKFHYTLNGKQGEEVLSATIPFVGDAVGGKTVDPENDGKDWWTNEAICDDAHDGSCSVHWRVWGNGKKSWWSVQYHYDDDGNVTFYEELPGISGVYELGETVTMTDTLPRGWQIDTDKPIFGRFVSMGGYAREDELAAAKLDTSLKGWFPVGEDAELPQQEEVFDFSGDGKPCSGDATCATYAVQDGKVTFTVPNNGTLTAWETERVGDATPGQTESDGGPDRYDRPTTPKKVGDDVVAIPEQVHAVVVFEFDTTISKAELRRQGMIDGSRFTYTNNAQITLGGHTTDVSGDTIVTQGEAPSLNKWIDNTGNNQVKYVVEIDLEDKTFDPGTVLTLQDTLHSSYATFVPGSFILSTNSGSYDQVTYPEGASGFTAVTGEDPRTGMPTATFTIPLDGMTSNSMDKNSDKPLYRQKKLRLYYTVQVRGIPGQEIDLRNTVRFTGNLSGSASSNRTVKVVKTEADAGASGSVTVTKTDESGSRLPGAVFKVCQVKLDVTPSPDWTAGPRAECADDPRTVTSDANGRFVFSTGNGQQADTTSQLYGFEQNTLYVAWETEAPDGFMINEVPQYFYLKNTRAADFDAKALTMAQYADAHDLFVHDGAFGVVDELTAFGFAKVGSESVTTGTYDDPNTTDVVEETPVYAVKNGGYLDGSEWSLRQLGNDGNAPRSWILKDGGDEAKDGDAVTQFKDHDGRDGYLSVRGLPAGEYELTETKAPDGHGIGSAGSYRFTLTATGGITWHEGEGLGSAHEITDAHGDGTSVHAIENDPQGVVLPTAGGTGALTHLIALGMAIVVAGLCVAIVNLRKAGRCMSR